MFFNNTTQTTRMILPTTTIAVALVLAIAIAGAAPVAAQTTVDNDTVDNATEDVEAELEEPVDSIIYQFEGGGELVDVEMDGQIAVTLSADSRTQFAIAEGDLTESGSFEYETVTLNAGQTRTVILPTRAQSVVVTTTQDGYYYTEASTISVVTQTPTGELLQLAAISGVSGTLLSLGIVIGQLKRRHENSYTELFSDERVRIEQDAVDGVVGWIKQAAKNTKDSKLRITIALAVVGYTVAATVGYLPTPFDLWHDATDGQRLVAAGTITTAAIAVFPVYLLVQRIWSPARSFVFDLDARDIYRAAGGDKSGGIAAYSAPPSRIRELEVDGGTTTIDTPGGVCHLVREMDPQENTAAGNPPEVADDREAILNSDHIRANREIMQEMADVATSIIGYLPTLRTHADFNAAKNIDEGIGDLLSSGGDSMTAMLELAVEGTSYESDEATGRPEEPDTTTDTMNDNDNDNDSDEATNDDGGQTSE